MNDKSHILLAEDDLNLGHVLSEYLTMKGFKVTLFRDGNSAWSGFGSNTYNLCILDVMMPKEDGFSLAKRIRGVDSHIPIIFLTAKNMQQDRIAGFMAGADDYLTKPFSMQELQLRIQAIFRRVNGSSRTEHNFNTPFRIGSLTFHPTLHTLCRGDKEIKLTNKETQLLHLLCRHLNKTLQRNDALHQIWGEASYYNARSMDVYIAKLRKLLKNEEGVQILTVHGEGFRLIDTGEHRR